MVHVSQRYVLPPECLALFKMFVVVFDKHSNVNFKLEFELVNQEISLIATSEGAFCSEPMPF